MAINIDKYRTDSKSKEPETSSGSFNFEKYRSGTQENKAAEYGQYADAMKSSRLQEVDTSKKRNEDEKKKQDAFNDTVYGGTNKFLAPENKQNIQESVKKYETLDSAKKRLLSKGPVGEALVERPSYGQRVKDTIGGLPKVLRPIAAPVVALSQAPFMVATREALGTDDPKREGFQPVSGGGKIAGQILAPLHHLAGAQGAGLAGGQLYSEAGNLLSKYAPNLVNTVGGRVAGKVIQGVSEGIPTNVGATLAMNPQASNQELKESALYGAGFGLLPGVGKAIGEGLQDGTRSVMRLSNKFANRREALGIPAQQTVDSVIRDVPEATQAARAADNIPLNSATEQSGRGQTSPKLDELYRAQESADKELKDFYLKMDEKYGKDNFEAWSWFDNRKHDVINLKTMRTLSDIKEFEKKYPQSARSDAVNATDESDIPQAPNVSKPLYNVGDESVPTSADGTELSGAAKIIDVQNKDGVNYYRFDGSNTYMPENQVKASQDVPNAPKPIKYRDMVAATQEPPAQGLRERGAVQNVRNNAGLSDELNTRLDQSPNKNYEVATDIAAAQKAIKNTEDMTQAEANYLGNRSPEKEDIATAVLLMKKLGAQGKHEQAANIYDKLIVDLTRGGQTSQAASLIGKLSPEGQLINLLRTAKANGKTVPVEDRVKFKDLAAKAQENAGAGIRENQFNDILNKMEKGENVTVAEIKQLSDYLSGAEKVVTPSKVVDDLPTEFKDVKKRDKIISFLDDAEQAALARIAARKNRLNALPLDEWADHAIVVSAQIAKGTIKAASHVEDLVKLFGEEIRPVASQVFQKAQGLVKGVSRRAGEGDIERARAVLNRATGQTAAEKAIVEETAKHVKKLIADAKAGKLDPADVQKLRDYSDEIAEMTSDKPKRLPTQDEKFLQSVKSLAKKIAQVESEKVPADQANREVSSLLRQVMKIADEGTPALQKQPIDNKALSDIAHDVMEKTRPNPKPTTLQEKIVEKYLKENPKVSQKDIDSLRDLAKNITRLSGDAKIDADIAMQKILNSYEKSSAWDKVQALRYMGMLLNTGTQAINALSGPIMATTGTVADVFGTMLDIALNKTLKTPRTTTLYGTNPLRFLSGYMKNLKTGAKAGFQGTNPAGIQGTNEIRGLAFKSLKNPLTFIPAVGERTLGAIAKGPDFGTYKTIFNSEMVKQGFISAKNQGIKGKSNIDKHIREFVNDPPEEAILQADRIGKDSTFQRADRTGGKVANYLNTAPALVKPGVNAVFPFVRTPINIASTAVTMTPAGIIKGLFQLTSKSDASRREAIRTLSMGVTGTGIGAVGYYLSQLGIITGANDSGDKDVDNIREQAGRGKYRFNTSALSRYLGAMLNGEGSEAAEKAAQYREGDKQFDYNKLQPLAFPLAAGASVGNSKDKPIGEKISNAGADSFGSLFGMSTLKGVQSVFQPSYGGTQGEKALGVPSRIAESFFKSFSPGGLAQEARRQDPIQRKTPFNDGLITNTTEYFKSRIPGLSQSLPSRKTTLGQDYKNAPGIKGSYLNPYRSEVAPYNKAAEIISGLIDRTGDLTLAPSDPEKTVRGKDSTGSSVSFAIPAERYAKLQEDVGNEIIKRVNAISTSDDKKMAAEIEDIYTEVRKEKMNEVKREFGIRVTR